MASSLSKLRPPTSALASLRAEALLDARADGDGDLPSSGAAAGSDSRFISRLGLELLPHLVRLLGGPTGRASARGSDRRSPSGQVEGFLRAQRGTDWDDDGRVAGFGRRHWAAEHPEGQVGLSARPSSVPGRRKSLRSIRSSPLVEGPEGRLGVTEEDRAQPVGWRGA